MHPIWEKYKVWIVSGFFLVVIAVICIVAFVVLNKNNDNNKTNQHNTESNEDNNNNNNINNNDPNHNHSNMSGSTTNAMTHPITIPAQELLQPGSIIHSLSNTDVNIGMENNNHEKKPKAIHEDLLQAHIPIEIIASPRAMKDKNNMNHDEEEHDHDHNDNNDDHNDDNYNDNYDDEYNKKLESESYHEHLIESVYVVNLNKDESPKSKRQWQDNLRQLHLPSHVTWGVVNPPDKAKHQLSQYMAHTTALSYAKNQSDLKHTLIVQHNVPAFMDSKLLHELLFYADKALHGRWHVIAFVPVSDGDFIQPIPVNYDYIFQDQQDQQQQNKIDKKKYNIGLPVPGLFRIREPKDTRICYLVNKNYIPILFQHMWESLRIISKVVKTKATTQTHILDEMFNMNKPIFELQQRDCWIGFTIPLISEQQIYFPIARINMLTPHVRYRLAFTLIVITNPAEKVKIWNQVQETLKQFSLRFLSLHQLEFFIFTNEFPVSINNDIENNNNNNDIENNIANSVDESIMCHYIKISNVNWIQDPSLYRFHILNQASLQLQHYHYVFHLPYHHVIIINAPAENELLVSEGLVITEHPSVFIKEQKIPVERRTDSFACILKDEVMEHYYSRGFFGGKSLAFLNMCDCIQSMINTDIENNLVGINKDESYLQRYFMDHKPIHILSSSYQYFPSCFDIRNSSSLCDSLRALNIQPVFVPLSYVVP